MCKVKVENNGGYKFNALAENHNLTIDINGEGVTPLETLLASLGSCTGVFLRKYLDGAGIEANTFSIYVEAAFTKEPPVCFKEINVAIDLKGLQLDDRRRNAILEFVKNCPVHITLKSLPKINLSLK